MREYRVVWEIDVWAESPEEAARQARAYQLNPAAEVGVFTIWDRQATPNDAVEIDLDRPTE